MESVTIDIVQADEKHHPTILCKFLSNSTMKLSFDCSTKPRERFIRVEYPFSQASNINSDLVLIPSHGDFLNCFNNRIGLHIGIVTTDGLILEYDKKGIRFGEKDDPRWRQCLRLGIMDNVSDEAEQSAIQAKWKDTVELFIKLNDPRWTRDSYDNDNNNCFDFVIEFIRYILRSLDSYETSDTLALLLRSTKCKNLFCQHFVLPKTKQAAKYISLYRKLKSGIDYIEMKT